MSLKDIFRTGQSSEPNVLPPRHALIDTSNDTLLMIGAHPTSLHFLSESMMDTMFVPDIAATPDVVALAASDPRTYPEWSWDQAERTIKRTNPDVVTEEMRERAALAAKKAQAVSQVTYWINSLRNKIYTGLFFQETIYAEKERQARVLVETNFDETAAESSPYVTQYAEDRGVSLRQAAQEILLQAQLDHEYLAKTEKMRLSLFQMIRSARTVEEIDLLLGTYRVNLTL